MALGISEIVIIIIVWLLWVYVFDKIPIKKYMPVDKIRKGKKEIKQVLIPFKSAEREIKDTFTEIEEEVLEKPKKTRKRKKKE